MHKKILGNMIAGLCALTLVFFFVLDANAKTLDGGDKENSELARMKAVLNCGCECGLTLAHCAKEDADCTVRPTLLSRLERFMAEGKRGMDLVRAMEGPMNPAKEQILEARFQDRYAILFFSQKGSLACEEIRHVLSKGKKLWGDEVVITEVDINKKENDKIREEYRIYSAPRVLVFAPNGVIVSEFKKNITVDGLENAFVTPATAHILRGLQDKRVIFLMVQGDGWKNAENVRKTVSGVGDILRNSVRVLHVNPGDAGEESLLRTLKVDKDKNQSLTYVISQSGQIGSRFEGPVSRKDLFMAFQKVLTTRSGCGGSGSGPGGNTCK
ncbi:MAG: hypothetical protein ISS61_05380 [Desulfobacteraceae bacterium]|nr:hypothetical protein [Desulfobacteraceae bacterium]